MDKKYLIGIFSAMFIIIVVFAAYFILQPNKEEKVDKSITIKDYNVVINSKKFGTTSDESYYSIFFDIVDDDKNTNTYKVDFVDVKSASKDDNEIYDIAKPGEVTINGKFYEYYLDESSWVATLSYIIPDTTDRLVIEVSGGKIIAEDGSQLKTLATVNQSVLESKELADILDYSINKKA